MVINNRIKDLLKLIIKPFFLDKVLFLDQKETTACLKISKEFMTRGSKKFFVFGMLTTLFFYLKIFADPKISIITSVHNGDEFIEGFMDDITRQTVFDQCELIMINANSSGQKEDAVVADYMRIYPNIIYIKMPYDPGLYSVWNTAIKLAKGEFITNANLDDRLAYDCYELHMKTLKEHSEIDLVYSDCYITKNSNETFENNTAKKILSRPEFSKENMRLCLPNNHPMWRKSFHAKYGFFNEKYRHAGDWELWLRAVSQGAVFLKVPVILGLYYMNNHGLSTDKKRLFAIRKEEAELNEKYKYLWAKK